MFTWIIAILSIAGNFLNVKKRVEGFYLWGITNLAWVAIDIKAGLYAQAALFLVYTGLAIWGIWKWRLKRSPNHSKEEGGNKNVSNTLP